MRRLAIQLFNTFLLIVILIGVPAVTSARFGSLQVSSPAKAQRLALWGLGLTVALDAGAGLWLTRHRKDRVLCWKWAAIFGVLFAVQYASFGGYINFDWLKKALQWLGNRW